MKSGTPTSRSAPLPFRVTKKGQTKEGQTKHAGFPFDFQELCSLAMDQALGMEKASLTTVLSLNSSLLDICESSLWLTPALGNLSDMVSQAVAYSLELQLNWLTLLTSYSSPQPISQGCAPVTNSGRRAEPAADELAYSMDIAIGECRNAPSTAIAGISALPARGKAQTDALERSVDIAIRAQAA